jgi:para-aminobenzoate synthetase / 4-amino-4-deoxychorismate lyase
MLVASGRPVELEAHLVRLERSARRLFGAGLPDGAREAVLAAAHGIELGRLRLDVSPGPRGRLAHAVAAAEVDPEIVFPSWENGAVLRSVAAGGWSGVHKWSDRAWLEEKEAALGEEVPLLVDQDGNVLEAGRANVFAVLGGGLATPPLDDRILPGIGRAAVLGLAGELGIEAQERRLGLEELRGAEEAFLTSSVRGVRPVRRIDEVELERRDGIAVRLAADLRRRWLPPTSIAAFRGYSPLKAAIDVPSGLSSAAGAAPVSPRPGRSA